MGAADKVVDVEPLELGEPVVRAGVIGAGDELESAARRRQDAQFLRELVETLGEAVVDRIVGRCAAAAGDRLIEAVDDVRIEPRIAGDRGQRVIAERSEEHTSELQSLMRISYAVFCLKKKKRLHHRTPTTEVSNRQMR